jgi:hypothetical protein
MLHRPSAGAVLLALLLLFALAGPPPAVALTHTVTCNAAAGTQLYDLANGGAGSGDTIVIPACTITVPLPITTTATPLTFVGAGPSLTILDGGGAVPVFTIGGGHTVTVTGLTIRNGHSTAGGGVINGGTLTLTNVTITGNTAAGSGASGGQGGGIYNNVGVLVVKGSTISGNTAAGSSGSGGQGGGIYHGTGLMTLVNVTVSGNTAGAGAVNGQGGGLYATGTASVTHTTVGGNTAEGSGTAGGLGGGIAFATGASTLTLVNATISGNSAAGGGGLGARGGGLAVGNAFASVNSSTITGNTAAAGVFSGGGGIYTLGDPLTLRNTIVAGNSAGAGANCHYAGGSFVSGGFNLSSDGSCAAFFNVTGDLNNANPHLGPLQNNGGPTATQALLAGSAAIDTGDDVGCPAIDQRGIPRIEDGNGDGVARCDIGAVEARPAGVLVSTGTGAGGGPHVNLFRFDPETATSTQLGGGFLAYDPGFVGGVQATLVSAGGEVFVVTGVGSGGGPHIKLFKVTDLAAGTAAQAGPGFLAYDPGFTGGARVAATVDDAGRFLIVTGVGPGGGAHVKVFQVTDAAAGAVLQLGGGFFAYDPGFTGGVNVGVE